MIHRFVLALVLVCTISVGNAFAARKWFVVESKNFCIYSDGTVKEVEGLAIKLERYRQLIARLYKLTPTSEPLSIIAFRNPYVFAKFRPYLGDQQVVLGYNLNAGIEDVVALALYDHGRAQQIVMLHEAFHALTQASENGWPHWLNEGSAEVFSTMEERDGAVILGIPRLDYVKKLRKSGLFPMKDFVEGGAESLPIFYPQAWAVTHWLTCADHGARLDALRNFLKLLRDGIEEMNAFQQAFGIAPEAVQKVVENYLHNEELPMWKFPLSSVEPESSTLTNHPISDAKRDCIFGNLMLSKMDLKQAESYFKQAYAREPDLPSALEGLGFVVSRRDQTSVARRYFEKAIAQNSNNYRPYFFYACVLFEEHSKKQHFAESVPHETAVAMVSSLKKAIALRPTFPDAYELLARLTLNPGEDPGEGLKLVKLALQFRPGNRWFLLTEAKLQMRSGDFAAARQTLKPVLITRHPELKKEAIAFSAELQ